MTLHRARAARAALTAPVLCFAAITVSAQNRPKPTVKKQNKPPVNRQLSRGEYAARQALSFRGVPYRFGGRSRGGVDCSGLIQTVWKNYGLSLPRTSVAQYKSGVSIPKARIKPGDLVFFKNTYKRGVSHVGIYVGENKFVHAANRRKGVILTSLAERYYQDHWAGARRVSLVKLPVAKKKVETTDHSLIVSDAVPGFE